MGPEPRGAGYRASALVYHFPLLRGLLSEGWELRQFSTQLRISTISVGCREPALPTFRNPVWLGEQHMNQKTFVAGLDLSKLSCVWSWQRMVFKVARSNEAPLYASVGAYRAAVSRPPHQALFLGLLQVVIVEIAVVLEPTLVGFGDERPDQRGSLT